MRVGCPAQLAAAEAVIRAAVKAQPDATLQELCDRVATTCKIKSDAEHDVSRIGAAEPPVKKKTLHASQRDTPEVTQQRADFKKAVAALDVEHFKFLDESGVNLSMTRLYGRAAPDQRVVDSTPAAFGGHAPRRWR